MESSHLTALIDLDAMLHIVASVQFKSGNRTDKKRVKNHVKRFVSNILVNVKGPYILLYQKDDHKNFRCDILPEYKGHREKSDAIICWKETILEAFEELGSFGFDYIETDDAVSLLAYTLGIDNCLIVTSDKDLVQIPCLNYNPFKPGLKFEQRWKRLSPDKAENFFWQQVITGDPTDMPGALCGVEGVGEKTAQKLLKGTPPGEALKNIYTEKYGKEGKARCALTYKMVKLLTPDMLHYVNQNAKEEVRVLLETYTQFIQEPAKDASSLFTATVKPTVNDLFKKL